MKTFIYAVVLSLAGAQMVPAQTPNPAAGVGQDNLPKPTAFRVVNRDANSRIWQRETYSKGPDGAVLTHIHEYTEVAAGLHYKNQRGEWVEAREEIEAFPGGAIARQGQYQVIFANNLNSAGSIDLQTSDGKRLRSHILGLAYYDRSTGDSALIAQIQDSTGELTSPNQVLYQNAFQGVKADVRYTYKKGSFEQDVILWEQPPAPEAFGLNSETVELEVMTEFINPPMATITERSRPDDRDSDQDVSWGAARLGYGKAFELGAENDLPAKVAVKRSYGTIDGRNILLERVPLNNVQTGLQKLPKQAARKSKFKTAAKKVMLPHAPLAQTVPKKPMQLAAATLSGQGYVLDYVEINTDQGDFTFQADTTYYLSSINYYDSIKFEGGTVLKYAAYADVDNYGSVTCDTGTYRPAVLTAKDDDSVGETISGSTGTPSGYYAAFALGQESAGGFYQYLHIKYAAIGLILTSTNVVSNCQFINNGSALAFYAATHQQVNNSLFWNADWILDGWDPGVSVGAANLTAHHAGYLLSSSYTTLSATNSLFVCVTNWGNSFTGVNCATNASDAGIFQVAGAGSHYLAADSIYRNAGTPALGSALLADLATKTTYPPVLYYTPGVFFGTSLNLSPQAQRDTDLPDLGYHYDPLDYLFGPTYVTNATITVNPGTAIGFFGINTNCYGFAIGKNAQLLADGAADNLIHFVIYNTVQEQTSPGWKTLFDDTLSDGMVTHFSGTNFLIDCRFIDWSVLAQDSFHISLVGGLLAARDCQFHGGIFTSFIDASLTLTNCLFERVYMDMELSPPCTNVFRNNLFWNGSFIFFPGETNSVIKDNLFDHASMLDGLGGVGVTYYGGHNAFVTNYDQLDPLQTGDIVLPASPAYQVGPLGRYYYYYPTNSPLINAGSTTADQVGLYHFTTQTNQVKETNSIVDIGYHYVAVNTNGVPFDTNGDGIPDYLEDANGNGLVDSGEIGWNIFGDLGLKVRITRPRSGSTLP